MALITTNRLFVDVELNRAYSQFGTFNIVPQPFFIEGDQCPVEISLVRQTGVAGSPFVQVPFDPTSTFALKVGNTTLVATSTTTATTPSAPTDINTVIAAYNPNRWQTNRVTISPDPLGGFFTLAVANPAGGTFISSPISVFSTASDIKNAILAFGSTYTSANVMVNKVDRFSWEISFNCPAVGTDASLSSTSVGSLIAYDSRVMQLDMTAAGVATLLDGAASVPATLEFSVDTAGEVQTLLLTSCTVYNDL